MQSLYSKGPGQVPSRLTKPSPSFKKHVWLSVLGLLFFIVLYTTLIIWFGKLTYYSWVKATSFWSYVLSGGYAFLCLFMVKSLFFFGKREINPLRRYLTEKEEPILFDFLYKLADEAGAPRPHKVFLTDRVNASVSYDLSIWNLIIPSKKNLEIGLGLVNVLSLGEFKAVLAHEFGHFAQRSMLLGRYVYIAQQIAVRIINQRDIFDKFLSIISSIDIRISWIGWILSILVWAVRSLIETCFGVVAIAERALSREMEFQADLVAVSLTGSDALIHALHRLQIADEAYGNALDMINNELGEKKAVRNLYELQSNYIEKMSWILNDPSYGKPLKVKENNPESHRIFSHRAYNPPQMWSTHPADKDREENAKRYYIASEIDDRPADNLLANSETYKIDITADLIKTAKVETETITDEEGVQAQNKKHFNWTFLDPKFNSTFLNRFSFSNFETVEQIYEYEIDVADLPSKFEELYRSDIGQKLEDLKEVKEEIEALNISQNEVITVEKRQIWHRGNRIKRKDISGLLISLDKEETELRNNLMEHDKLCRSSHFIAAKQLGNGWDSYLKDTSGLIHYSEHAIRNINDAARKFHNVITVALADGNISSTELTDILNASNDYYKTIKSAFDCSTNIKLDTNLLAKFGKASYAESFEEFKLGWPSRESIDDWVKVVDGWAQVALNSLHLLRNISLERLLEVEDEVREVYRQKRGMLLNVDSESIMLPKKYDLLTPGKERKIQRKLKLWDRFMIGEGLFGATAKFGVSALLIFGVILLGGFTQNTDLYIYNGLGIPVTVKMDGADVANLSPFSYTKVPASYNTDYKLVTISNSGETIDEFKTSLSNPKREYIYNIAGAGAFLEYAVFYGYDGSSEDIRLGNDRWIATSVDYILKDPPGTISTSTSRGERRDAIVGYSDLDPYDIASIVDERDDINKIAAAHIEWDAPNSPQIINWINIAGSVDVTTDVFKKTYSTLR